MTDATPRALACRHCGEVAGSSLSVREYAQRLSTAASDRDEWKIQHDNLLVVKALDNKSLSERIATLTRELAEADGLLGEAERVLVGSDRIPVLELAARITTWRTRHD